MILCHFIDITFPKFEKKVWWICIWICFHLRKAIYNVWERWSVSQQKEYEIIQENAVDRK